MNYSRNCWSAAHGMALPCALPAALLQAAVGSACEEIAANIEIAASIGDTDLTLIDDK